MSKPKPAKQNNSIAENRQARHEYFIEETYEAGMALQGWEVKSLRAGRAQLKEAYAFVKNGEAFLFGAHISALPTALQKTARRGWHHSAARRGYCRH